MRAVSLSAEWKSRQWILLVAMMAMAAVVAAPIAQAQTATTTTLTLTASSSPVSSVTSGTVVTFTAAVSNGSAVTAGTVIFCNGAAAYCLSAPALIGTAQLTSAGIATIRLVPGIGIHSYTAVFKANTSNAASTSSPQPLTVTGLYPSATTISPSGLVGNYTLTGGLVGTGSETLAPTGSLSFLDTTNSNYIVGSATLGTAALVRFFATQVTNATGSDPESVAVGDGSTLSSTQLDAAATGVGGVSLPGTFVYSPAAGTVPAVGSDTLSVTFTPTDGTDYNTATATVTLTVAGFSLTENNGVTSQMVTAGAAATFNLTVSPVGSSTLLSPVALSITGLPPDATATFTPATVAAGSAATAVKLVIQTTGLSTVWNTEPSNHTPRNIRLILLMLLVLPLLTMQLLRKRMQLAPRLAATVLFATLSLGAVVGLSGCSAAVSTPPHSNTTFNLVVTETSGAVSHNFNLTLIVQK